MSGFEELRSRVNSELDAMINQIAEKTDKALSALAENEKAIDQSDIFDPATDATEFSEFTIQSYF